MKKKTLKKPPAPKKSPKKAPPSPYSNMKTPADAGFDSAGWQAVLFWYSQAFYGVINTLGFDKAKEIVDAGSAVTLEYPLWMPEKDGKFKEFELPYIGRKSGPYIIAAQSAFLVWTQKQLANNELPDSPIFKACLDGLESWRLLKKEGVLNEKPASSQ